MAGWRLPGNLLWLMVCGACLAACATGVAGEDWRADKIQHSEKVIAGIEREIELNARHVRRLEGEIAFREFFINKRNAGVPDHELYSPFVGESRTLGAVYIARLLRMSTPELRDDIARLKRHRRTYLEDGEQLALRLSRERDVLASLKGQQPKDLGPRKRATGEAASLVGDDEHGASRGAVDPGGTREGPEDLLATIRQKVDALGGARQVDTPDSGSVPRADESDILGRMRESVARLNASATLVNRRRFRPQGRGDTAG